MLFHENRLLADDSHEISILILSKIGKNVTNFVVCCSLRVKLRVCNKKYFSYFSAKTYVMGTQNNRHNMTVLPEHTKHTFKMMGKKIQVKNSEYDQEIPQSKTADKPMAS